MSIYFGPFQNDWLWLNLAYSVQRLYNGSSATVYNCFLIYTYIRYAYLKRIYWFFGEFFAVFKNQFMTKHSKQQINTHFLTFAPT